ncbi:MAG TPA: hypothetical protein VLU47_08215 [Blastocatellia bacterium]|nr:hypothetical protein [Blastocatellia bacterium]
MGIKNTLLLICTMLLIPTCVASANRCWLPGSLSEEFEQATSVFSAKVVAEEYRLVEPATPGLPQGSEVLVVRLSVARWWKGDIGEEAEMYTMVAKLPDGSSQMYAEDYRFEIGKEYLIYAFGPPERLRTSVCTRTVRIEKAEADLRKLGEGNMPRNKTRNGSEKSWRSPTLASRGHSSPGD